MLAPEVRPALVRFQQEKPASTVSLKRKGLVSESHKNSIWRRGYLAGVRAAEEKGMRMEKEVKEEEDYCRCDDIQKNATYSYFILDLFWIFTYAPRNHNNPNRPMRQPKYPNLYQVGA